MEEVLNNFFKKENINASTIDSFLTSLIFQPDTPASLESIINALRTVY